MERHALVWSTWDGTSGFLSLRFVPWLPRQLVLGVRFWMGFPILVFGGCEAIMDWQFRHGRHKQLQQKHI